MSEEVNQEQTKPAKQKKITKLSDEQLEDAAGGATKLSRSAPPDIEILAIAEQPRQGIEAATVADSDDLEDLGFPAN